MVNKQDFISKVAEKSGFTKVDTKAFEVFGLIHQSCAEHFCICCVFHNLLYFNIKLCFESFLFLQCKSTTVIPSKIP